MPKKPEIFSCPHCGQPVKKDAAACPHCGSDEHTGWSESTYLDGMDFADEIDYDEAVRNEFPHHAPVRKKISWVAIAGAVVLACFIAAMLKFLY